MASSNLPHPEERRRRVSKDARSSPRPTAYDEFWRRYLAAHRDPRTRAVHYAGTTAAVLALVAGAAARDWRWLAAAPLVGYGCAWFGHAAFEHNRPETFGHPVWSLASDFRMLGLFLAGRLGAELRGARLGGGREG